MKRRDFLKSSSLILAAGTAFAAKTAKKPNILFIMTDQQFADALGCAGNKYLKTPNIDSIASSGTRFTRAYCSNPICVPSRTSLFTGRYPHAHGKQTNNTKSIDTSEFPTMGTLLSNAGYATGYVGKWHLPYKKDLDVSGFNVMSSKGKGGDDPRIAAPSVKFIKDNADNPFLLICSFMNPHNICQYGRNQPLPDGDIGEVPAAEKCPPAPENMEKAKDQADSLELLWQGRLRVLRKKDGGIKQFAPLDTYTADDWRKYRWAYYRMVELVDKEVGKILSALREAGLEDNTIVIFTSDHGDGIGAHRWAQKNMFYDECARIPLIISGKGTSKKSTSDYLVNNGIDLLPTICDYAGARLPAACKGQSLRKIVEGKNLGKRKYVACSTHFVQDRNPDGTPIDMKGRMIRTDQFKYYIFDEGKQPEMLIDMLNDPGEMVNLVGNKKYKNVLVEHRKLLKQYKKETGDNFVT